MSSGYEFNTRDDFVNLLPSRTQTNGPQRVRGRALQSELCAAPPSSRARAYLYLILSHVSTYLDIFSTYSRHTRHTLTYLDMGVKVYVKSTLSTALTVSRHTLDIRLDSLDIEFPRLGHSYVSRYVKVSIDSLDSLDIA